MATSTQKAPVATGKVVGRRELHFECCDDVVAECDRLLAGYRHLGNWSLGQMASHLAEGLRPALEPTTIRVPWIIRFAARNFFKKGAMQKISPGIKLPKGASSLLPDAIDDRAGVEKYREMIHRWKQEPKRFPHPFFGLLTDEEWDKLLLRHAEMHLSFLIPKEN